MTNAMVGLKVRIPDSDKPDKIWHVVGLRTTTYVLREGDLESYTEPDAVLLLPKDSYGKPVGRVVTVPLKQVEFVNV